MGTMYFGGNPDAMGSGGSTGEVHKAGGEGNWSHYYENGASVTKYTPMVVGRASSVGGGAPYMSWGWVTKKQPPEDYKALLFYVEQILDRKLTQEETTIILALAGGENHVPEE